MKVLILYPIYSSIGQAYWDSIEAFKNFSKLDIYYLPINTIVPLNINLSRFDCLILHYGICLYNKTTFLNERLFKQIAKFKKLKIYLAQDEYTTPVHAIKKIRELGIHHIFSCIPNEYAFREVYPKNELPDISFDLGILAGYVSEDLEKIDAINLRDRKLDIIYRGNNLGYLYGSLGAEKFKIGMDFIEILKKNNLKADIDWRPESKIFGEQWIKFLQSGRVMLCTESGSSLIHKTEEVKEYLLPSATLAHQCKNWQEYEYAAKKYKKYLQDDRKVVISGISPKVFEAIACKTVLVCNEGYYSGVLKPNIHYISLRKDLSNIDEVVAKIKDLTYLEAMSEKAYNDIIVSGYYTYKELIKCIDSRIEEIFALKKFKFAKGKILSNREVIKHMDIGWDYLKQYPLTYLRYYSKYRLTCVYRKCFAIVRKILSRIKGIIFRGLRFVKRSLVKLYKLAF